MAIRIEDLPPAAQRQALQQIAEQERQRQERREQEKASKYHNRHDERQTGRGSPCTLTAARRRGRNAAKDRSRSNRAAGKTNHRRAERCGVTT